MRATDVRLSTTIARVNDLAAGLVNGNDDVLVLADVRPRREADPDAALEARDAPGCIVIGQHGLEGDGQRKDRFRFIRP